MQSERLEKRCDSAERVKPYIVAKTTAFSLTRGPSRTAFSGARTHALIRAIIRSAQTGSRSKTELSDVSHGRKEKNTT